MYFPEALRGSPFHGGPLNLTLSLNSEIRGATKVKHSVIGGIFISVLSEAKKAV